MQFGIAFCTAEIVPKIVSCGSLIFEAKVFPVFTNPRISSCGGIQDYGSPTTTTMEGKVCIGPRYACLGGRNEASSARFRVQLREESNQR